jgi:hypothetical protein
MHAVIVLPSYLAGLQHIISTDNTIVTCQANTLDDGTPARHTVVPSISDSTRLIAPAPLFARGIRVDSRAIVV